MKTKTILILAALGLVGFYFYSTMNKPDQNTIPATPPPPTAAPKKILVKTAVKQAIKNTNVATK